MLCESLQIGFPLVLSIGPDLDFGALHRPKFGYTKRDKKRTLGPPRGLSITLLTLVQVSSRGNRRLVSLLRTHTVIQVRTIGVTHTACTYEF